MKKAYVIDNLELREAAKDYLDFYEQGPPKFAMTYDKLNTKRVRYTEALKVKEDAFWKMAREYAMHYFKEHLTGTWYLSCINGPDGYTYLIEQDSEYVLDD